MSQDKPTRGSPKMRSERELYRAAEEYRKGRNREENVNLICSCCWPALVGYFLRRGVPLEDCEDLAQDTLTRLSSKLDDFRGDCPLLAYVFSIARNVFKRWLRRRRAEAAQVDALDDPSDRQEPEDAGLSPEERAEHDQRRELVRRAVEGLPPKMRGCVKLRIYHNLSYREIAAISGVKPSTVGVTLKNATERLKKTLEKHIDIDERDFEDIDE